MPVLVHFLGNFDGLIDVQGYFFQEIWPRKGSYVTMETTLSI